MATENGEPGGATKTTVGNYFVANYPPFSFWSKEDTPLVSSMLQQKAQPEVPFGFYVHIPYCRRRCDFCYFRVYTGKEARSVDAYVDALIQELRHYSEQPYLSGRRPKFVYFGGGTPSFLSVEQLRRLFAGLSAQISWSDAEEVTFECEPGTLDDDKIHALRDLGVTRLSLGVENFDPKILELNNRAHRATEIHRAYALAREVGFPQINIDLISGMVGETEENWQACIEQTRAMKPDSVTIYQMEIPYNTTVYQRMRDGSEQVAPVAGWEQKRRWVKDAFAALEADGYRVGSGYTAVKDDSVKFLYRDSLWRGADMLGIGVASFSHVGGIHFQNDHHLDPYLTSIEDGEFPFRRALAPTEEERLIREFVLQLKLGEVGTLYFQQKFGVDVREFFKEPLRKHAAAGWLAIEGERIVVHRAGLLRIDELLSDFFLDRHRDARYT